VKKAKGEMRKKRGEVIILASRPRAAEGREKGGGGQDRLWRRRRFFFEGRGSKEVQEEITNEKGGRIMKKKEAKSRKAKVALKDLKPKKKVKGGKKGSMFDVFRR